LRYAAVWCSLMLFSYLSSALGYACGCFHATGWLGAVIAPHTSTYEVRLPDVLHQWTDTIDICDVWTLYLVFTHEALPSFPSVSPTEYNSQ
jgi:hypothetical protein